MPLRYWQCTKCDDVFRSKSGAPSCCDTPSKKVLTAPQIKLQTTDEVTGKSTLQDQEKILKARARNYSRDNELDDLIAKNDSDTAKQNQWLTEAGVKRKAVDDI